MNENLPPQENNKNMELEELLKLYPLPEKHRDKGELALKLKNLNGSIVRRDSQENGFKNHERIHRFALALSNKYKEHKRYYLYNMLVGSTGDKTTEFDFPGEDSIEKYLKMLDLSSRLDD